MTYLLPDNVRPGGLVQAVFPFILIAAGLIVAGCWMFRGGEPAGGPVEEPAEEPPAVWPGTLLTFPTPQTRLDELDNPEVFMPTASGRVESAWYGSTRTRSFGDRILPAFHGGVDIAPMERDGRGRAKDPVYAVADGRVGYINRVAGNSSYGIYAVLLHSDPSGEFYTLYSHLASAEASLGEGDPVQRGQKIGRMGHTSTLGIPVQRSHLHFEFGTVLNSRFIDWYRMKKLKPFHGTLHGYNLAALNPMELFPHMMERKPFLFGDFMFTVPAAFRLIVPVSGKPDYYRRYPFLWEGGEPSGAMVMEVSESGVPLKARPATDEESAQVARGVSRVAEAFPDVLGRNGMRLVTEQNGRWSLGSNAARWLEILLY
jgi:murein DD-endopeptidase MepM/ murein hydrolase activator NlpD